MMNRKTSLFLFTFFVLNCSVCFAQLSTLNLVYSGVGGLSDVVKFAHEGGFFKKNGLDVTLIYVNSGVLASQVVASGTAGAAAITATDALRVMSAGVPMKIIMVNIDQFQHLFVARPGIKKPGDMKGKRVAVSRYGSFSISRRVSSSASGAWNRTKTCKSCRLAIPPRDPLPWPVEG